MDEILKLWADITGLTSQNERKKQIKQAKDFVFSYAQSPGFKERFLKSIKYLKDFEQNSKYNKFPEDLTNDFYNYKYGIRLEPNTIYTRYDSNADSDYFDPKNNTVYFSTESPIVFTDYGGDAAHEYGHAISNSIIPYLKSTTKYSPIHNSTYEKTFRYPDIFPHFRNSNSYLKVLSHLDPETKQVYELYPKSIYEMNSLTHDAEPGESYADLMSLRYDLNQMGIYDSRKANHPFTQEHLNKYKALNRHNRIFDNFTDEQIILMMNEVAQNNTTSNNQNLYAGIKLIPRKNKIYS